MIRAGFCGTSGKVFRMKKPRSKARSHRVSLNDQELLLVLGALAETLEERRQSYRRVDLARLVRLHRRLDVLALGFDPEYVMRDGAVVSARNPEVVIVPAPPTGVATDRPGGHA